MAVRDGVSLRRISHDANHAAGTFQMDSASNSEVETKRPYDRLDIWSSGNIAIWRYGMRGVTKIRGVAALDDQRKALAMDL